MALPGAALQAIEETAPPPRVAGDAGHRLDAQEHRVGVAIEAHLDHALHMARGPALLPQGLSRARPVVRNAGLHRARERFAVHPREHQHFVGGCVLRDRGHQPVGIPRHALDPVGLHNRISIPRAARKRFASGMVISPKWNTEAASTASARPSSMPRATCSSEPTPPLAITGTVTPSDTARAPPPTVSGMKTWSATRSITSTMVSRASLEAVMSRKVISSAPAASYLRAISTGSPASRSSTNFTPFTTRPAWTSRHGMMRLASPTLS